MTPSRGILTSVTLAIALALSGCASTSLLSSVLSSSIDPKTRPAFLDEPQTDADLPPAGADVAEFGIDPATLRYQGNWDGDAIYLGVKGATTVAVVRISLHHPEQMVVGHSEGNTPVGVGSNRSERRWLVYLPQGSAELPAGVQAFSPHMAAVTE